MDDNYMDPKTANLDPKLKEAYERIMGTTVAPTGNNASNNTINNATTKPVEAASPIPQAPKLQVQEVKPEPLSMPKLETPPPLPPQPQQVLNEMVQSPQSPSLNPAKNPFVEPLPPPADIMGQNINIGTPKKKSKLMPIALTLGGLIFFVLYGVIWAKVFNLF